MKNNSLQKKMTSQKSGFTLLETLIAIVLITMGIAPLIYAFGRGITASGSIEDLRVATALAQAKIEALKDTAYGSLADEAKAAVSGFTGFSREVDVTASPGGTDANLTQIDVTVYWDPPQGSEESTTLTTFRANF